jgi:hypothetical protein
MRKLLLVAFLLVTTFSFAQTQRTISIIDFVKIKNNRIKETMFYYENNWKLYRDIALEKGYIESYKLLTTSADSTANFDLMLITEYADSSHLNLSEERFQQIIKTNRPNGPRLLNEIKPADFRINLFLKETETIFSSDKNRKVKIR